MGLSGALRALHGFENRHAQHHQGHSEAGFTAYVEATGRLTGSTAAIPDSPDQVEGFAILRREGFETWRPWRAPSQ
jgi:hypothetical protein